jgi:hypothetical protein
MFKNTLALNKTCLCAATVCRQIKCDNNGTTIVIVILEDHDFFAIVGIGSFPLPAANTVRKAIFLSSL